MAASTALGSLPASEIYTINVSEVKREYALADPEPSFEALSELVYLYCLTHFAHCNELLKKRQIRFVGEGFENHEMLALTEVKACSEILHEPVVEEEGVVVFSITRVSLGIFYPGIVVNSDVTRMATYAAMYSLKFFQKRIDVDPGKTEVIFNRFEQAPLFEEGKGREFYGSAGLFAYANIDEKNLFLDEFMTGLYWPVNEMQPVWTESGPAEKFWIHVSKEAGKNLSTPASLAEIAERVFFLIKFNGPRLLLRLAETPANQCIDSIFIDSEFLPGEKEVEITSLTDERKDYFCSLLQEYVSTPQSFEMNDCHEFFLTRKAFNSQYPRFSGPSWIEIVEGFSRYLREKDPSLHQEIIERDASVLAEEYSFLVINKGVLSDDSDGASQSSALFTKLSPVQINELQVIFRDLKKIDLDAVRIKFMDSATDDSASSAHPSDVTDSPVFSSTPLNAAASSAADLEPFLQQGAKAFSKIEARSAASLSEERVSLSKGMGRKLRPIGEMEGSKASSKIEALSPTSLSPRVSFSKGIVKKQRPIAKMICTLTPANLFKAAEKLSMEYDHDSLERVIETVYHILFSTASGVLELLTTDEGKAELLEKTRCYVLQEDSVFGTVSSKKGMIRKLTYEERSHFFNRIAELRERDAFNYDSEKGICAIELQKIPSDPTLSKQDVFVLKLKEFLESIDTESLLAQQLKSFAEEEVSPSQKGVMLSIIFPLFGVMPVIENVGMRRIKSDNTMTAHVSESWMQEMWQKCLFSAYLETSYGKKDRERFLKCSSEQEVLEGKSLPGKGGIAAALRMSPDEGGGFADELGASPLFRQNSRKVGEIGGGLPSPIPAGPSDETAGSFPLHSGGVQSRLIAQRGSIERASPFSTSEASSTVEREHGFPLQLHAARAPRPLSAFGRPIAPVHSMPGGTLGLVAERRSQSAESVLSPNRKSGSDSSE